MENESALFPAVGESPLGPSRCLAFTAKLRSNGRTRSPGRLDGVLFQLLINKVPVVRSYL